MTGQKPAGLVLDLTPDPTPAPSGAGWASLREIGGWWGLLRYLPGAVRQVFSGREQPGGLPVVEPGQTRPVDLPEIDFNPGAPITDHAPAVEADAVAAAAGVVAEALAEEGPEVSAESAAPVVVVTGEQMREEWLATHDAGTELQDWIEAHADQEADQAYEVWLAQEQADYDAGTGPYAAEPASEATGPAVNGQDSDAAAVEAVAELGEAGL